MSEKLTPKQLVLAKWPAAECLPRHRGGWEVWHRIDTTGDAIGFGLTPQLAWAAAADGLKGKR